jgi:adenylate cyclase
MSPLDTFSGIYTAFHGLGLLSARRFAESLAYMRRSIKAFPDFSSHYNTLISCCGHLGLLEEAQTYIEQRDKVFGFALNAGVIRQNLRQFAHVDVFVEGLQKAGVPE